MMRLFWKPKRMKYVTTHESKKLHYRKYLYKIRIANDLASIFRTEYQRNGKLSFARTRIDQYQNNAKHGYTYIKKPFSEAKIRIDDLRDAKIIYKHLLDSDEYLIRCEYNAVIIYSNNFVFLQKLLNDLVTENVELWKPKKEYETFLKDNINSIIVNNPVQFEYKVTFGRKRSKKELATWIKNNPNQVKATEHFIEVVNNFSFIHGLYLYAKNEKTLLLLKMIVGDNITRIDKLIYKADIDK
jgi:hypothetical protein